MKRHGKSASSRPERAPFSGALWGVRRAKDFFSIEGGHVRFHGSYLALGSGGSGWGPGGRGVSPSLPGVGLRPANITVVTWRWAATMHGRPLGLGLAGPEPQGRRRCQGGPYAMEIRERGEEQSGLNAG